MYIKTYRTDGLRNRRGRDPYRVRTPLPPPVPERAIWGTLKPGTELLPELEENMRFTTYRYDPVFGKHFALARFYDAANGRMMSKDPVKRGLNP